MRNYKIILFLSLIFICFIKSNAQEVDFSKPINSGFVFIDGKYIETPYKFKKRGMKLYLNNILIYQVRKRKNINPLDRYSERISVPANLNKNSTAKEYNECIVKTTGVSVEVHMSNYYLKNYPYEQAVDSLEEFIRKYPNVKEVNCKLGLCKVTFYNKETTGYMYGGESLSLKWGPNGTGNKQTKDEIKQDIDLLQEYITDLLLDKDIIYIIPILENKLRPKIIKVYNNEISYFMHITQDENLTNKQKNDSLYININFDKSDIKFINLELDSKIIKKIHKLGYDTLKYSHE